MYDAKYGSVTFPKKLFSLIDIKLSLYPITDLCQKLDLITLRHSNKIFYSVTPDGSLRDTVSYRIKKTE